MKRIVAMSFAVVALAVAVGPLAILRAENPGEQEGGRKKERPAVKEQQHGAEERQAKMAAGRTATRLLGMTLEAATETLKFTPDQVTALEAIVAEATKLTDEWESANAEKLNELREAAKAAREDGNREAAQEAMKQMGALNAALAAKIDPLSAKAIDVLTPEQKKILVADQLVRMVTMRWRKVELTEEQKQAVQQAAEKTAADNPDLNPSDKKAMGAAAGKLSAELTESVLTAEQREQLPKRAERPARPKVEARGNRRGGDDEEEAFEDEE